MLAALLAHSFIDEENVKSGANRLRQAIREDLTRDFSEQDPDWRRGPPVYGVPLVDEPQAPRLDDLDGALPTDDAPGHLPDTEPNYVALMETARTVGLGDEMASAILSDDEEAIIVILMAAEL